MLFLYLFYLKVPVLGLYERLKSCQDINDLHVSTTIKWLF